MTDMPWWRRSLPGDLGPLVEPEREPDTERYRLAVSRLRGADADGNHWVTALAAWEVLRRLPTDADGAVVITDRDLRAAWQITGEEWSRWRGMLIRSGLLLEAPSGYYVNPLQASSSSTDAPQADPSPAPTADQTGDRPEDTPPPQ